MARSKAGRAIPHTGQYVRHVQVWLTDEQFEKLNRDYKACGFRHREAYLRQLIAGTQPRAAPPLEYGKLMDALYRIGNNMNQVAVKAHALNVMDVQRYDEAYHTLLTFIQNVTAAFLLPAGNEQLPTESPLAQANPSGGDGLWR